MNRWFACVLLVAASGCPDVSVDPGQTQGMLPTIDGPTVEFDPANSIIPFPNNLVIDPTTGRVTVPAPACETPTAMAIRTGTLNQLDGFGTFEAAMQVTFTEAVDPATLAGNIVMYQRAKGTTMNDPSTAMQVPVTLAPATTLRFDPASCSTPATINAVNVIPMVPLDEQSTYTVAVLEGVNTMAAGTPFIPSTTWALVRQSVDPVQLGTSGHCSATTSTMCSLATDCPTGESCVLDVISSRTPLDPGGDANGNGVPDDLELNQLDGLWKAHAAGLAFLDGTTIRPERSSLLVAWEVTTQTTTDPLDPQVSGSPAATLATGKIVGTQSITCQFDATTCPNGYDRTSAPYMLCGAENNTVCFLEITLGAASSGSTNPAVIYGTGQAICAQVGCAAVADILAGGLGYTNYQTPTPNPMAGGATIPGQWTDPVHPVSQGGGLLQTLIFVPTVAAAGPGPYPTLVFGHGLGSSKNALFAFAPQLASAGFASAAIDFVASGSRAIQDSNDPTIGCSGTVSYAATPQCFAPILTANLGQTRDNIRQTVLDLQRLVNALYACGSAGCQSANSATNLTVDTNHIVYTGQSLGGIIGTTTVSVALNITASVLNVPAVGLLDVLENSKTLEISCPLVDALITAGVVVGAPWNGMDGAAATGLCTTNAWQMQPGYAQFSSVARWVLDPADGANFMAKLVGDPAVPAGGSRRFLIQEVIGDMVVPNVATNDEGELSLGAADGPSMADPYIPGVDTAASTAVTNAVHFGAWVQYPPVPGNGGAFPGNTFQHASLLEPVADTTGAGQLGTARMQTDAITYLVINK